MVRELACRDCKCVTVAKICPSCKSTDIQISDQDIVEYFDLLAAKTGTKIEVISGVAEHGLMLTNIGKVGAILRYNPNYSN